MLIYSKNLYNATSERLWEKLEYYKSELNLDIHFDQSFPIDQLIGINLDFDIAKLIQEVENEFDHYGMTEFQCSWSVNQAIRGGLPIMQEYNKNNGTCLEPRA